MRALVRGWLQLQLSGLVQRTLDEDARVRWMRGPVGRELAELAGPIETAAPAGDGDGHHAAAGLEEGDRRMLHLLTEGQTNREIAEDLGIPEDEVARRLREIFTAIGASSRAEATTFAFRERIG